MTDVKVVKNESAGYGYSYASLGDIAKQGFTIPKMKTGTEDGRDFVYYLDGNEWIRGAEIVIPESKQMNTAQIYGAALTYARRYTTLMAMQLACDDDKEIENTDKKGEKKTPPQKPVPKPVKTARKPPEPSEEAKKLTDDELIAEVRKLYREDEIKTLEENKHLPLEKFGRPILELYYTHRHKEKPKKEPVSEEAIDITAPVKMIN